MKHLLIILFVILISFPLAADLNMTGPETMNISFVFPNGKTETVSLLHNDVGHYLSKKKLPANIDYHSYKLDIWVFEALLKLNLDFDAEMPKRDGMHRTKIIRIGDYENSRHSKWVLYVNGIRTKFHISTLTADNITDVRFVFKSKKK